jgi:hypothetical protein
MAKKSISLLYAAIFLSLVLMTTTAFINKSKELTSGGGIAGGHLFNYTAVENKSVITGHFMWNGTEHDIVCVKKDGQTAIIYLKDGLAVKVVDSKDGDRITAPFAVNVDCSFASIAGQAAINVDGGNLTVFE